MDPVAYLPLTLVGIFALGFPKRLRFRRPVRLGVGLALGLMFVHYMAWRIPVTLLPADDISVQSAVVWIFFAIEMLAWYDTTIVFASICRRNDRSPEADAHEARLRALPSEQLPVVDVFIATYNEPIEVLERTIVGAMALDWPAERLRLWVLDDGRRGWLAEFCRSHDVGYLTRPDNAHAKAGNINAALARTSGEFVAVFDADFIPQRNFLFRMMGFFADPRVGIVQAPHRFFNNDPLQANLALRRTLPNDQSLFFGEIMPGRDAWDCAFCCGSNSITRRSALREIGDALPTDSITEDMLLTLALFRKGYVTRYLNERLAIGLAPESLDAFFVQRARWARGALQILYLRTGPLGPGLTLVQRLMFLPAHALTMSLTSVAAMMAPCLYLLTGLMPLLNVTTETVLFYQLPIILGFMSALRALAPGQYFPLTAMVLGVLQSFRFLPMLVATLIRPRGHAFRVTPKGRDAAGPRVDTFTVVMSCTLLTAMGVGLALNAGLDTRVVPDMQLVPVVGAWCGFNALVLLLSLTASVSAPPFRAEERFEIDEPALARLGDSTEEVRLADLSLSGAAVRLGPDGAPAWAEVGTWLSLAIAEVGELPARIVRHQEDGLLGVHFHLPPSPLRDRLIRKIFTAGLDNATINEDALAVTLRSLAGIFTTPPAAPPAQPAPEPPPALLAEIEERSREHARWDLDIAAESGDAKTQDEDAA